MSKYIDDVIKVIFFDHDDTLVGTIGPKWRQHKHVAKKFYNRDLAENAILEHWGKPFQELICLLYGTDNVEEALANNTTLNNDYPKEVFVATVPTLQRIHDEGKKIGIVTATSRQSLEHDLDAHHIPRDLIEYTQAADDSEFHKPDPRVFEPALQWLKDQNILPNEVVYVGDALHDMKAALGTGFAFLGVETGLVTAEEFRNAGARSIPTIEHLLNPEL